MFETFDRPSSSEKNNMEGQIKISTETRDKETNDHSWKIGSSVFEGPNRAKDNFPESLSGIS